jgi:hypothetical protein
MNLDAIKIPESELWKDQEIEYGGESDFEEYKIIPSMEVNEEIIKIIDQEENQENIEEFNPDLDQDTSDDDSDSSDVNKHITESRVSGVNRALKNLEMFFHPYPWEFMEESASMTVCMELYDGLLLANIHDGITEPKNIMEAAQTKQWPNWWEAMSTKFKNSMEDKKVWEIVNRKDIPPERKVIGNQWVFTIKDDGCY